MSDIRATPSGQPALAVPAEPYGLVATRVDQAQEDFDLCEEREIGCVNCDGGWRHGCCDDLCRGCNEPEWCDYARPCSTCNPHGEVL